MSKLKIKDIAVTSFVTQLADSGRQTLLGGNDGDGWTSPPDCDTEAQCETLSGDKCNLSGDSWGCCTKYNTWKCCDDGF